MKEKQHNNPARREQIFAPAVYFLFKKLKFIHSKSKNEIWINKQKNGYYIDVRKVLTNIFWDRRVHEYVTATHKATETRRLFFSTVAPESIRMSCTWQEKAPLNQARREWMQYVPLFLYPFRWNIEVGYYEQKNFWSLCAYMVRSKKGTEILANLINISYCAMKIPPYKDETFSDCRDTSVQEFHLALSEQINQQVIFATFVKNAETSIKSLTILIIIFPNLTGTLSLSNLMFILSFSFSFL